MIEAFNAVLEALMVFTSLSCISIVFLRRMQLRLRGDAR